MTTQEFLASHLVRRIEQDELGYGDGLGDIWRCDCGDEFEYDGVEEYSAHLLEVARKQKI
jgi:hypothetical protein